MKRIITVSMTAVSLVFALLMCMLLLVSCQCKHTYAEWETVKAATCTEAGERTRTCSKCGEVETESVAATGHDFGAMIPYQAPTCSEDGILAHEHCTVCGKNFIDGVEKTDAEMRVEALGHSFQTVGKTDADCTTDGVLAHLHCTVCGSDFVRGEQKT